MYLGVSNLSLFIFLFTYSTDYFTRIYHCSSPLQTARTKLFSNFILLTQVTARDAVAFTGNFIVRFKIWKNNASIHNLVDKCLDMLKIKINSAIWDLDILEILKIIKDNWLSSKWLSEIIWFNYHCWFRMIADFCRAFVVTTTQLINLTLSFFLSLPRSHTNYHVQYN